MIVAIVRYNAGNVCSVQNALARLSGVTSIVTDDPKVLAEADRVIVPGVGEARSAMFYLRERGLDLVIRNLTQPVLGICLGLQLFCQSSEENETECLGIFSERVRRIVDVPKVPHMGWNTISGLQGKLFQGIPEGSFVYFVHSFSAEVGANTSAVSEYPEPFSAALEKNNFFALQFHPEKSCLVGQAILENFVRYD